MNQQALDQKVGHGKLLGGLGVVFALLYAVAFVGVNPNSPGINATPAKVMTYYNAHHGSSIVQVFLVLFSTVAFAFFAGGIRSALFGSDARGSALSHAVTAGTAIFISGLLLMAALQTTLLDATHNRHADVVQTVNYLASDDFFPVVVGLAIFALATGIAIVRSRALPVWLGWFAIALGVLAMAGPIGGIAFMIAPVWALVAGIVLIRRDGTPAVVASPAQQAAVRV